MRGVVAKFLWAAAAVPVLVVLAGAPVQAFEETTVLPSGSGQDASAAPAPGLQPGQDLGLGTDGALDLTDPATRPPAKDSGTEVTIPGIGTIGVLPKLDFGLELLYGKQGSTTEEPVEGNGGLSVGGRVKHTF